MTRYCDHGRESNLKLLMDLCISSTPQYEVVFGILFVYMCASLVHEGFTRFYSCSLIKLSIIGWCLVNINIPALKTEYKIVFLENGSNDFD
jgi:hypothetical protein